MFKKYQNTKIKKLYKEGADSNNSNKKTLQQQFSELDLIMKKMKEAIQQDKRKNET